MKKFVAVVCSVIAFTGAWASEKGIWRDQALGIAWEYVISDGEVTLGTGNGAAIPASVSGKIGVPETVNGCPVRWIASYAFLDCAKITEVTIPEGVTSIGGYAFSGCDSLVTVRIPSSVRMIGDRALIRCENLTDIAVDEGNEDYKSIDGALYDRCGQNMITCPAGKRGTFKVADGVFYLGIEAFAGCTSLTKVGLPETLMEIPYGAFSGCCELTSIELPPEITSIGMYAFFDCTALKAVNIPAKVEWIGGGAFAWCESLSEVHYEGDAPLTKATEHEEGGPIYYGSDLVTNYVQRGSVGWTSWKSVELPAEWPVGEYDARPILFEGGLRPFIVVTSPESEGEGSLREAVAKAQDGDEIRFAPGLCRITLKERIAIESSPFADKGLVIGNIACPVAIEGNDSFELFVVNGKVMFEGVTFAHGKGTFGGAIWNNGNLTIRKCKFIENSSPSWGGAICNRSTATLYAQDCEFVGNTCDSWGGAIASHTAQLTTLLGCRFIGNSCEAWGGALAAYGSGDMLVVNCEIRGNHAYSGAVVAQSNARLTLIGSTLTDNVADFAGADVFNLGGTVNAIGSLCRDNHGQVTGTTDLQPLPVKRSSLVSTDTKALGNWYSKTVDANGSSCLRLNDHARPRFAPRMEGRSLFEMTDEDCVSMPVENVKPYLYYGLGWSDTPDGDYHVEPGRWIQADANGNLPGEVKAPRGKGNSRFFRVKVTDDPMIAK